MKFPIYLLLILLISVQACTSKKATKLDLSEAKILVSQDIESSRKVTLTEVITEEIASRTGLNLTVTDRAEGKTLIILTLSTQKTVGELQLPEPSSAGAAEQKAEGYRMVHTRVNGKDLLWIIGKDARSLLFGIGQLLRSAEMTEGNLTVDRHIDIATAPVYPIRGHQFGYRNTANSWDAWTVEQFDQHFREQMLFGANAFENIPFQDGAPSVHMKESREDMNLYLSNICDKYDADYWVWTPATFDLKDQKQRQAELDKHEAFYKSCPRLDGVFFPGGDPGDNHPEDVLPFLEDLTELLHKYHPEAGMWISLQGFNKEKVEYFFKYVQEKQPKWLKGVANGPSSPPLDIERKHLPEQYMIRSYPDLTHTVRCQYPVERWDQAFALTLGRECTNPQPLYYQKIHNQYAPYTNGFLSYSDGIHDDVNKVVWSQMGWNPEKDVKELMREYANVFFGTKIAGKAADGILALEQNWTGPLQENEGVKQTLALWQELEARNPSLRTNWRWQQLVMRAYYDAYIQERQAYEQKLETEAYDILAKADETGADKAMELALEHLQRADTDPVAQELKEKAVQYLDDLFHSVGLQTSVPKYQARGYERGCVLDFIDYPLNNRWWLEDEFSEVAKLPSEDAKIDRLNFIRSYSFPGEGSFYDNISSADARHVISETDDAIDYLWENNGLSRKRLSTQLFQFTPVLEYDELDPDGNYLIRVSGYGEALLRANDVRLEPTKYEKDFEEFKEFPLPKELIKDGKLKITFDKPDEEHLNWRKQSRVTDVWILKR